MSTIYVDSSSWIKLIKPEAESEALRAYVDAALDDGDEFVSSALLITEMGRIVARDGIERDKLSLILGQVNIFVPELSVFRSAGRLPASDTGGVLRSLDALHVAHCLEIGADVMLAYDDRQIDAALAEGVLVVHPGK